MKFSVFFNMFCLFLMATLRHPCHADNSLSGHLQLLIVTSDGWESKQGTLQCFERINQEERWTQVGEPMPVMLGKAGMAWGIGLYRLNDHTPFSKIEGDLKSPAGIFSLGFVFGFFPKSQMTHLKMDYLELNEFMEAVDDPQSDFYNCIVDSREVIPDWSSSEKMREEPLYEIGLVINHNFPQPESGKGSAIFFHRWRHDHAGTAGCTAMSQEDLEKVLCWLEKSKNPVLIQLPHPIYSQLQTTWNLPSLISKIPSTN
jgi:zinc D-Ala-D-Ala dipeptidase